MTFCEKRIRELCWGEKYYINVIERNTDTDTYYILHFLSDGTEFHCDLCNTNKSSWCRCKDRDWQSNFLKYTAILYSFNLEAIDITFTQMADAIEEIKYLNRSEIFEWLVPNLHPEVEPDADY